MITAFLRHHLDRAQRGEITNGLANCHANGLFSVMLHDEPGNRIRMFLAAPEHEMTLPNGEAALAIHAHRTDIILQRIYGSVRNYCYSAGLDTGRPYQVFRYSSGVTGSSSLEATGETARLACTDITTEWDHIALPAKQLHIVTVPPGREAAWLVFEGKQDPTYESVCYSASRAEFDPTELYQPLRPDTIAYLLERVSVLMREPRP